VRALLLPLGEDTYALPVDAAREVVSDPRPVPLPGAPGCVRGLINVRGEIVPLLDLGILLGASPAASAGYAVVVDAPAGRGALAATALPEVAELGDQVAAGEIAGVLSVHRAGNRLVTLLDLHVTLDSARIAGA
jgi:purine-binding chemotaxis protein CheW